MSQPAWCVPISSLLLLWHRAYGFRQVKTAARCDSETHIPNILRSSEQTKRHHFFPLYLPENLNLVSLKGPRIPPPFQGWLEFNVCFITKWLNDEVEQRFNHSDSSSFTFSGWSWGNLACLAYHSTFPQRHDSLGQASALLWKGERAENILSAI